jgi:hypothetical protein
VADKFLVQRASEASVAILGEKKEWANETNGWEFRDLGMAGEMMEEAAQAQGLAEAP